MKLYATPLSHFSRKIRILLDLYGIAYEFIDVGNVAEGPKEKFAGNPLMRVPVLVDGAEWVVDSDHIAEYLVRKHDPQDRYQVLSTSLRDRNLRAILNGVMAEEVTVILARRLGVPTGEYVYFADALDAIRDGLSWLEANVGAFDAESPGYKEFHLLCAWEHIAYYELDMLAYPKLEAMVKRLLKNPALRQTSPHVLKPKEPIFMGR